MQLRYWFAGLAIAVGAVGLYLDFSVISDTMTASAQNPVPRSLPNMLIYYWTFLTNLSNLGLILVYLSDVTRWPWLNWFRHPVTRAGMAGIMMLVMFFYHFMLAPTLPEVPQAITVSNILLHYVTPILYLGWWFGFATHGTLRFRDVPTMLVPGLSYVAYVLVRGLISGEYPYTISIRPSLFRHIRHRGTSASPSASVFWWCWLPSSTCSWSESTVLWPGG